MHLSFLFGCLFFYKYYRGSAARFRCIAPVTFIENTFIIPSKVRSTVTFIRQMSGWKLDNEMYIQTFKQSGSTFKRYGTRNDIFCRLMVSAPASTDQWLVISKKPRNRKTNELRTTR